MIIRRFLRAMRSQDWSTLIIELLVVVVAIFLGLQVDDWNEARKDAAQERVYLERLLADVDEMIADHETFAANIEPKLDHIVAGIRALSSCSLAASDKTALDYALLEHQGLRPISVVRTAYDEMIATGALARIDNAELKQQISRVYAFAEEARRFREYFSRDLGRASDIIWRHVSFDLRVDTPLDTDHLSTWASEGATLTVSYDFDALCDSSEFRNAMIEVFDSNKDRLGLGASLTDGYRVLREQLQGRLN